MRRPTQNCDWQDGDGDQLTLALMDQESSSSISPQNVHLLLADGSHEITLDEDSVMELLAKLPERLAWMVACRVERQGILRDDLPAKFRTTEQRTGSAAAGWRKFIRVVNA